MESEVRQKSQLAYEKFCAIISELAEGRDNRDIVASVRKMHPEQLADITSFIVDNAITNIIRNIRRRTAILRMKGGSDLFAGHSVPAMTTREVTNRDGRHARVNIKTEHLTKGELREKVAELASRPPRRNKKLRDYEALLLEIDGHCSDEETVEVGLRRSKGYE